MSDTKALQLGYARPGLFKPEPSAFWTFTGIVLPNVFGVFCGAALIYLLVSGTMAKYDLLLITAIAAFFFGFVGLLGAVERSKFLICWNSVLFLLAAIGLIAVGLM